MKPPPGGSAPSCGERHRGIEAHARVTGGAGFGRFAVVGCCV